MYAERYVIFTELTHLQKSSNMKTQTEEILHILQEECAEVSQVISKIFRFGFTSKWQGVTNTSKLEEELGDVVAMIQLLVEHDIVKQEYIDAAAAKKRIKLHTWSTIFTPEENL